MRLGHRGDMQHGTPSDPNAPSSHDPTLNGHHEATWWEKHGRWMQAGFAGLSLAAALAIPASITPSVTGDAPDLELASSSPFDGPSSRHASTQVAYATYDVTRRDATISEARAIAAPEAQTSALGDDLVSLLQEAFSAALSTLTEAQHSAATAPSLEAAAASPAYAGMPIGDLAPDLQRSIASATTAVFTAHLPGDTTHLLDRTLDSLAESAIAVVGDPALTAPGDAVMIDGPVATLTVQVVADDPGTTRVVVEISDHEA